MTSPTLERPQPEPDDRCAYCNHPKRWHHQPAAACTEWGCTCPRYAGPTP